MAQLDITADRRAVFNQVLAEAEPGVEIIYHVGDTAGGLHKSAALSAAQAGLCRLYQRKLAKFLYQYVALKRGDV